MPQHIVQVVHCSYLLLETFRAAMATHRNICTLSLQPRMVLTVNGRICLHGTVWHLQYLTCGPCSYAIGWSGQHGRPISGWHIPTCPLPSAAAFSSLHPLWIVSLVLTPIPAVCGTTASSNFCHIKQAERSRRKTEERREWWYGPYSPSAPFYLWRRRRWLQEGNRKEMGEDARVWHTALHVKGFGARPEPMSNFSIQLK